MPSEKPGKKQPNPVDKHIGGRVRMRRMVLGMSQEKLGDALNLTFQQVQKYEKGTNRIGGSRMQQIARTLHVSVSFFYEGAPGESLPSDDSEGAFINDFMSTSEGIACARAMMRIADRDLRRRFVDLMEETADCLEPNKD